MANFRFSNALKTMRILWGGLTASTVMLVAVAVTAREHQRYPMESLEAWVLLGVGAVIAVVSFVLPLRLHANAIRQRPRAQLVEPQPTASVAANGGAFARPADAVRQATPLAMTSFMLSMALSESVSALGFVVAFLGGPVTVAAALFAGGTLLTTFRFPTRERVLGPFERAHGATFAASKGGEEALS